MLMARSSIFLCQLPPSSVRVVGESRVTSSRMGVNNKIDHETCHPSSARTFWLTTLHINMKNFIRYILFFFLLSTVKGKEEQPSSTGPFEAVNEKYQNLSPRNKFIAAAALGFVGSRLTVNVAVNAIKITGAAFIV